MIRAVLTGRMHGDPQSRTGQSGKPFATAGLLVDLDGEQRAWCSLVAFGDAADRLMQLRSGDALAASGRLKASVYEKAGAAPRVSFGLVADEVAAVRRKPRQRGGDE